MHYIALLLGFLCCLEGGESPRGGRGHGSFWERTPKRGWWMTGIAFQTLDVALCVEHKNIIKHSASLGSVAQDVLHRFDDCNPDTCKWCVAPNANTIHELWYYDKYAAVRF